MFTERAPNQPMRYAGGQQRLRREIGDGDSATLKARERLVLVRKVHVLEPSGLSGEVYGFEPAAEEHAGMRIGQRVSFSERHVYSYGRGA